MKEIVIFTLIVLPLVITNSQTPDNNISQTADSLFTAGNWSSALELYQTLSKQDPKTGRYHFRSGFCLHKLGKYNDAADEYVIAESISHNPLVMYNLACAYSRLNKADDAIKWLNKAIDAGFNNYNSIESDEDFASLKDKSAFNEVILRAKKAAEPCKYDDNYRQFDFWIGEWNVTSAGQPAGQSSIQLILGSCVIFENWTGASGYTGKSFNIYDPQTKAWKQTWVDQQGTITEFINGKYSDGKMVFYTADRTKEDGTHEMRRLTFFNLPTGQVRQFSEISNDGGNNWNTEYDLLYTRKN